MTIALNDRVAQRLQEEQIIWLTTVRANGAPTPTPVWFYWDGTTVLLFSQPDTLKVRNIERNPQVALNFHTDADGGDVAIIWGTAVIDTAPITDDAIAPYLAKYAEGIKMINMTPESMRQSYSTVIRITPNHIRSW